jgi:predicted PhzF superfamily epimerase YddE/YHI9
VEVRAFVPSFGGSQDPVTGGRNAGSAQWMAWSRQPAGYGAGPATVLGSARRVRLNLDDDLVPVGGDTHLIVRGSLKL